MGKVLRQSTAVFLLVMAVSIPAYAENQVKAADRWEFRLMPYVWIPTMKANATINGLSGNIKLNPSDIIDYLDFGAMGRVEAWKGKWGFSFDGLFMNLGASQSFQGRRDSVVFNIDADVRLGMADFGLMYRLFEKSFGKNNQQKLTLEPYVGLRYGYLRQKIDLDVTIPRLGSFGRTFGTSEDWVEPFIGGRLIWDLNDKIAFNVRADAGGFGIGNASDLTWQVVGGMDYKFSKNWILNVGYRYVDLDYSHGSGDDKFGIRLKAYGPVIGLTILF
jgi:opacity protein-like surface antigen